MIKYLTGVALICLVASSSATAGERCDRLPFVTQMIIAKSTTELQANRVQAGEGYLPDIVYSFKLFELLKNYSAAGKALAILPSNNAEFTAWETMSDSLCDGEPVSAMYQLDDFKGRIASLASEAAVINPEHMPPLISFVLLASEDPHTGAADKLETVCRDRRAEFLRAINALDRKRKRWLSSHLFDIEECKSLSPAESED